MKYLDHLWNIAITVMIFLIAQDVLNMYVTAAFTLVLRYILGRVFREDELATFNIYREGGTVLILVLIFKIFIR